MAGKSKPEPSYWEHRWVCAKWNAGHLPWALVEVAAKAAAVIVVARLLGVKI